MVKVYAFQSNHLHKINELFLFKIGITNSNHVLLFTSKLKQLLSKNIYNNNNIKREWENWELIDFINWIKTNLNHIYMTYFENEQDLMDKIDAYIRSKPKRFPFT